LAEKIPLEKHCYATIVSKFLTVLHSVIDLDVLLHLRVIETVGNGGLRGCHFLIFISSLITKYGPRTNN